MPTFCRKAEVASFYSSLIQPFIKLCHRQNSDKHTDEIIHPVNLRLASLYFLAWQENMRGALRLALLSLNINFLIKLHNFVLSVILLNMICFLSKVHNLIL